VERSAGENQLWKYFSLSQRAQLVHSKPSDETLDRLAMLSQQMDGLSKKIDASSAKSLRSTPTLWEELRANPSDPLKWKCLMAMSKIVEKAGVKMVREPQYSREDKILRLYVSDARKFSAREMREMEDIAELMDTALVVHEST
jgi:hypothetical protein